MTTLSLQRIIMVGSGVWALAILLISVSTFNAVNPDARIFVGSAILLSSGAALAAVWFAFQSRFGWAAGALLVSVVAPTYAVWVVNVLPLVLAGLAIAAARMSQPRLRALSQQS